MMKCASNKGFAVVENKNEKLNLFDFKGVKFIIFGTTYLKEGLSYFES